MPDAPDILNATLIARRDLNPELAVVTVRPDSGVVPDFHPGQFTTLGLPAPEAPPANAPVARPGRVRLTRRAYSIASAPSQRDAMEFFVVLVETGKLTPRLWHLHEGDRLWMDEKISGHFTLQNIPPDQHLVMISTGTGLAPFISMTREYHGQNRWRRLTLINGVRVAADLGYVDELSRLAAADPGFTYIPTVTREPESSPWRGFRGRVQSILQDSTFEKLARAPLDPADTHLLLCGNPQMIEEVQKMLEPRGFTTATKEKPGNIHFERYW